MFRKTIVWFLITFMGKNKTNLQFENIGKDVLHLLNGFTTLIQDLQRSNIEMINLQAFSNDKIGILEEAIKDEKAIQTQINSKQEFVKKIISNIDTLIGEE